MDKSLWKLTWWYQNKQHLLQYFPLDKFCFLQVNQQNLLKWFLLIMCKTYFLTRSTNLLSRNNPKVGRCPILINFMIISNYPESYNEFLGSWHLQPTEVFIYNFSGQSFLKPYLRKKLPSSFCKHGLKTFISFLR